MDTITPGAQLLAWLNDAKLTQLAFSGTLDVTPSYVSYLINGTRRPSLELAFRIESLTGIPARAWTQLAVAPSTSTEEQVSPV